MLDSELQKYAHLTPTPSYSYTLVNMEADIFDNDN